MSLEMKYEDQYEDRRKSWFGLQRRELYQMTVRDGQ